MIRVESMKGMQVNVTAPAAQNAKKFNYEALLDATDYAIELQLTDSQLRYLKKLLEKA